MKSILERFTSKRQAELQAEAEADLRAEREAVIAELHAAEADYKTDVGRLNTVYQEAVEKHQAVKLEADAAFEDVRSAERARDNAAYEIDRRLDTARNRLEQDLCPAILTDALERLEVLAQKTRDLPVLTPSGEDDENAAKHNRSIAERLAYITHTARPALLELRYQSVDLETEIEKIMSGIPE